MDALKIPCSLVPITLTEKPQKPGLLWFKQTKELTRDTYRLAAGRHAAHWTTALAHKQKKIKPKDQAGEVAKIYADQKR